MARYHYNALIYICRRPIGARTTTWGEGGSERGVFNYVICVFLIVGLCMSVTSKGIERVLVQPIGTRHFYGAISTKTV
jgi:hypothetical protein